MKGNFYTLVYAAALGIVCALLLTAAATFTEPYETANKEADEIFNILVALKVPLDQNVSPHQMVKIFNENIRDDRDDKTVYIYSPRQAGGKADAIALRFAGPGLWGPIEGFLALEADKKTIRGITFYEHEETPGLGGEISADWFQAQFEGKLIVDQNGKPGIVISKSTGKTEQNQIDAITGATMTCDKIQAMLNKVIYTIVEEAD